MLSGNQAERTTRILGARFTAPSLALVLAACSEEPAFVPRREVVHAGSPDILLVSIDSLRADHLGCYGYSKPTSPTIDELARAGTRFETAISTTSWTLPAHAALFTGLVDSKHGLIDNGLVLAESHVTLAEVLRAGGWRTAGFYGGPYLHPTFGLAQGFEQWTSCMSLEAGDEFGGAVRADIAAGAKGSHEDVTGPRTLEAVKEWSRSLDARPFFLFVHLWDVHYDYKPPARYLEMFDPDYTGTLVLDDLPKNPAIRAGMPARDLEHLVAAYDAEIRFTDDVLKGILDELEQQGRLANTLVVVTADHGEEFFEHGDKGHQKTLFDEVLRVPLVVRWPGHVAANQVVREPVRLIDVFPTIAALAGTSSPLIDGRDLGPSFRSEVLPPVPALCELLVEGRDLRALRAADFKILRALRPDGRELWTGFDLGSDAGERYSQTESHPRFATTRTEFLRMLESARDWREHGGAGARPFEMDPAVEKRLRALGYTDSDR